MGGGLGYTYQNAVVLIGSKTGTTRTPATLTNAYASGLSATVKTGGMSKINLDILYTTGTGETNNSIEIKVESSPDGTNFYQIPNEAVSGATSTLTQREFTFVGASAATAYSISLPIDVQDAYYKFSFKESGVASNAGTLYVEAVLGGAK